MSGQTLEEMLVENGITEDEWRRGRKVFEEMWRDVARINDWVPRRDLLPRRAKLAFPLALDCQVSIEFSREPDDDAIAKLIEILSLMRATEDRGGGGDG